MITFVSESANLGDNLMLTPLLNATPCKLRLYKEEWMEFVAPIFNNLCEIEWFTDKAKMIPPSYAPIARPWSKRLLVAYGFNEMPAIPKIKLTENELADGRRFVEKLQNGFGKPLCVIKQSPAKSSERCVPIEIIDRIVAQNSDVKFITFNFGSGHPKESIKSSYINNVFELINFPVRAEAAIYSVIGRYVGCDSGPYHLMLSVGGKADVLCPACSSTYNYEYVHYGEDCWLDEEVRVAYQDFTQPLVEGITGIKL